MLTLGDHLEFLLIFLENSVVLLEMESRYVAHISLAILLPQLSECWDVSCVAPYLAKHLVFCMGHLEVSHKLI